MAATITGNREGRAAGFEWELMRKAVAEAVVAVRRVGDNRYLSPVKGTKCKAAVSGWLPEGKTVRRRARHAACVSVRDASIRRKTMALPVQSAAQPDVLLCMGTRPEIVKMAPVAHALAARGQAAPVLHTGQHEDMAWPLYRFFGLEPAHRLELARSGTALAELGACLLGRIDAVLARVRPRSVLVQGDTSSALMGALAAFYRGSPVGHVEAGLRTHTPAEPFPEEMNRSLIARLARWHFAPTVLACQNLMVEGISRADICVTGNTVIDAVHLGVARLAVGPRPAGLPAGIEARCAGRKLLLVTAHRRENWGTGIAAIAAAVAELLAQDEAFIAVWPVHGNPAVADTVNSALAGLAPPVAARLVLTAPLEYPALLWLLRACWLVLTDSGGIQEEACALAKPVLVLRDATERPELIAAGGGVLVGAQRAAIVATTRALAADAARYRAMQRCGMPFGDGHAGEAIAARLAAELAARDVERL